MKIAKIAILLILITAAAAIIGVRARNLQSSHREAEADGDMKAGDRFAMAGRPEDALALYKKAVREDPTDVAAREGVADQLEAIGRRQEAVAVLQEGVRVSPKDRAVYHYDLACLYGVYRDWAQALEEARQAVAVAPDNMLYRRWMVFSLEHLKRYDDARAEWNAVLKLHPQDPVALRGVRRTERLRSRAARHAGGDQQGAGKDKG